MYDLSPEETKKFWLEDFQDPKTYKIISLMEQMEDWTLDGHPEIEARMLEIAQLINDSYKINTISSGSEKIVIQILCSLKIGRALRILYILDAATPGIVSDLINYAENLLHDDEFKDFATLFIDRNVVFERMRLLSKIFAEKRLTSIINSIKDDDI